MVRDLVSLLSFVGFLSLANFLIFWVLWASLFQVEMFEYGENRYMHLYMYTTHIHVKRRKRLLIKSCARDHCNKSYYAHSGSEAERHRDHRIWWIEVNCRDAAVQHESLLWGWLQYNSCCTTQVWGYVRYSRATWPVSGFEHLGVYKWRCHAHVGSHTLPWHE